VADLRHYEQSGQDSTPRILPVLMACVKSKALSDSLKGSRAFIEFRHTIHSLDLCQHLARTIININSSRYLASIDRFCLLVSFYLLLPITKLLGLDLAIITAYND